ncbi:hypothetical protein [uncultured Capnocytophaga sp.]|uniref:hypothetical protein n=1 Tax=uncultured Capnocytophaga sp. TaxID=159273 RepID=UPI002628C0DC|nr:hypothetical protein [uncultured Capnocytophaga sp.]
MKVLPLLALLPLSLAAQTPVPSGNYKANSLGNALELRFLPNGTYELIATLGEYVLKDKKILFQPQTSSFVVEKKQSDSQQLQITLKTPPRTGVDPRYLYIGYENAKGEVEYVCVYNKIDSLENIEEKKDSNGETYYVLESFEVPRTANLYLVDAHQAAYSKNKEVNIQKFPIGKDTNAAEITVLVGNGTFNLNGTYNPDKQTISVSEGNSSNAILFSKANDKPNPNQVPFTSKESVSHWTHFIDFEKERDIPRYDPDKNTKEKAKAVVSVPKNLNAALASADKQSRLVVVFQQPDNPKAKEEFNNFFAKYKEEGIGYNYEEDNESPIYPYEFYLATAKDLKTLKAKGVPAGNQLALLDVAGNLIYSQPATIEEIVNDELFGSNANVVQFGTMAMACALDKALSNNKLSVKEIQAIFTTFLKKDSQRVYLLAKNRPEQKTGDSNEEEAFDYIAQEAEDYFSNLKNPNGIYQMRLTPDQAIAQWERVVNAHKKDTKFDPEYAFLLSLNNAEANYYYRIFNAEKPTTTADIDAIAYLVKFADEIKAYNKKIDGNEDYYMGYNERLEKGIIEVNYGELSNQLEHITFNDKKLFDPVKTVYKEGLKKKLFSDDNYIDFLYDNNVDEAAVYFGEYYKNLLQKDGNLIVALDKAFSEGNDENSWKYYKMRFANRANNIAWKVFEEHKQNPDKLNEAFQWSSSAVQLEPENSYYLDTFAHLLYARGEKQKALEIEEKAVKNLPKAEDGGDDEKSEIQTNFEKMKKGEI